MIIYQGNNDHDHCRYTDTDRLLQGKGRIRIVDHEHTQHHQSDYQDIQYEVKVSQSIPFKHKTFP